MKKFLLICLIGSIYSFKFGGNTTVVSHPNVTDSIPTINRIIVPKALGKDTIMNQNVSNALEYYLIDYMTIINNDSLTNFYQQNNKYSKDSGYSFDFFKDVYREYHCKYMIIPSIKFYGVNWRRNYLNAKIGLIIHYELYDIEKLLLMNTFEVTSIGMVEKKHNVINIKQEFDVSGLQPIYNNLSLELVNKIRAYLKIKHKYDYILEQHEQEKKKKK